MRGGKSVWLVTVRAHSLALRCTQDDCRYALFDFDYKLSDGGLRNKLLFIVW